jgi:predicted DNA-binding transcriptional regulator YafY
VVVKRQARLFALAEAMRARKTGVTAEALADRFGVSVRTIYRDLDALGDAGLPLLAERGRGGGYALDRAYTLPPVNFSAREAAVLTALGQWAKELRFVPFVDTLEAALDKVRGALSASDQRRLAGHAASLRFAGIPAAPCNPDVRRVIEEAWFSGVPADVGYVDRDGVTSERQIEVRGLFMDRMFTIVEAFDLGKEAMRHLRLDRIIRATLASAA